MTVEKPVEVAVIGSGCAAMTTAFELTRPEHGGKYHVTVYQMGWRLGGKGASGRGPADRIEEHGLHVWMGSYENAFRMMREAYAELDRDPRTCRIASWRDAFVPEPVVGLAEDRDDGWHSWLAHFPPTPGLPGDPLTADNPWSVSGYMGRTAFLLRTLLSSALSRQTGAGEPEPWDPWSWDQRRLPSPADVLATVDRLLRFSRLTTLSTVIQAARTLELICEALGTYPLTLVLQLVEVIAATSRRFLESWIDRDEEMRRIWTLVDIATSSLRGLVRADITNDPRGFDALEDLDWREWLHQNGASEKTLRSTFVRSLYDLAFAYEDGDPEKPGFSAGAAVRGTFRMFYTYRGSFFWKMRAGMGDIVFGPLYEVLRRRGVSFRFFHRLTGVRLAPESALAPGDRPYVEALELDVQAEVKDGGEYQPLVDIRGLPCWPSVPDYDQLADGERMKREGRDFESHWDDRHVAKKVLRVGEDFDFVVLGVSVGAVPHVCGELVERNPRWRDMVENLKTVATQSFQLWLHEELGELGWNQPAVTYSGFVEPFDTWADMRHLLPEESWIRSPRTLAYFCNTLPTPEAPTSFDTPPSGEYPISKALEVRDNAVRFLDRDLYHLWPRAAGPGGFRWELLADPDGTAAGPGEGSRRFATQYWRANVNPTDRYVLSLPGTLRYRISPLDHSFDNLTIAGDWTNNGLNYACVEAAVVSGRLAAHAISLRPALEDIVGYDHP